MADSADDRSFSHVKHLREIRDRINKKLEHMTAEEAYRWHKSREYKDPTLRRLMAEAKPPKPPCSEHGTARALGLLPYPKYRPSGVEWLGDVPEHWEVAALRRVVASIRASNVDKHVRSNEITVKLCNYVDVYHNDRIDSQIGFMTGSATTSQIEHFQLQVGDVLITKDSEVATDIGVPSLVVERVPDLVAGYHLALIRPNAQRLIGSYLFRALQSDMASLQFTHGAQGVTRYGLTYASIKSVRLPVPPPHEQHAIASYLDRETAKIDALIRPQEILVEKLEEHRAALVSWTVTRGLPPGEARKAGLDPHPKLKPSGVEWLGDVPEHWEMRRGKYIFRPIDIRSVTGTEELLTVSSIHGVVPRASSSVSVTMFKAESYVGSKLCWPDDLVINSLWAWAYGLGVSSHHGIVSSAYGVYRLRRLYREYASYIHWLVRSRAFQQELQTRSKGIWISRLQLTDESFLAAFLPVPPAREQAAIAEYLDQSTQDIAEAITLARQEVDLLREYRARLISDVVAGKVDVRGIAGVDAEAAA